MVFDAFVRSVLTPRTIATRRFCFILGAGASCDSGIPTGSELAKKWFDELVDVYDNGSVEWNDWKLILKEKLTEVNRNNAVTLLQNNADLLRRVFVPKPFTGDKELADFIRLKYTYGLSQNYGVLARECFIDQDASDFEFNQIISQAELGEGYKSLAEVLALTKHNIIITTNFDTLVTDAFPNQDSTHTKILIGPSGVCEAVFDSSNNLKSSFLSGENHDRLVVKIHSDASKGGLLNTLEETRYLPDAFTAKIDSILQVYTPIVIGYSGGDLAFMDLLLRYSKKAPQERTNIYWFVYGDETSEIPNEVRRLIQKMHGEIVYHQQGFNDLMPEIHSKLCPHDSPQNIIMESQLIGDLITETQEIPNEIMDEGNRKTSYKNDTDLAKYTIRRK